MQSTNALSLTSNVNAWLANSRHPRILHVFDRACNLINERREVLSVVNEEIGDGPFNIVLEGDVIFSEHLSLESPISAFPNKINLADLTIHTEYAKLWSPCPNWEMLHVKGDDILNQLMSLRGPWSFAQSNPHASWDAPFEQEIASSQRARAFLAMTLTQLPITNYQFLDSSISNSLAFSLAIADLPASLIATKQLAGLGNGLTPAGDDFIMGAVLAAWIIHPSQVASSLAKEITEAAAALTTSLSGAWLGSAGRGEAGILWHQFFESLLSGDLYSTQLKLSKLLAVGHTSGADALSGFVGTLRCWVEGQGDSPSKVTQHDQPLRVVVPTVDPKTP